VEQHPYAQDIELCENLIYYCTKTFRSSQKAEEDGGEEKADGGEAAQKKIEEFVQKGKI